MPGARQKAPHQLVNQRGGRADHALVVDTSGSLKVPRMPRGLRRETQQEWRAFWADPELPYAVRVGDWGTLHRWIVMVDMRAKLWDQIEACPEVDDHGTFKPHPMWMELHKLDAEILKIADRFGMNPQSRFRLQIKRAEAEKGQNKLDAILARRNARPTRDVTP